MSTSTWTCADVAQLFLACRRTTSTAETHADESTPTATGASWLVLTRPS
ncbi:MAG: hypothetical protein IPG04_13945 [Polyangiaceae bacterium]|nr:hypothetical protein [Polyangiaceae bacterium]